MGFSRNPLFEEMLKKKYEIAAENARAQTVESNAQADYLSGRNDTEKEIAKMRFNEAGLQYKPGGAQDRLNVSNERRDMYGTDAQRPVWDAQAARFDAETALQKQLFGAMGEVYPSQIAKLNSANRFDTSTNESMLDRMNKKPVVATSAIENIAKPKESRLGYYSMLKDEAPIFGNWLWDRSREIGSNMAAPGYADIWKKKFGGN